MVAAKAGVGAIDDVQKRDDVILVVADVVAVDGMVAGAGVVDGAV